MTPLGGDGGGPLRARLALLAWGLATLLGLAVALRPGPAPAPAPDPSATATAGGTDLELYRRVVDRVRRGEPYHDAAGAELRAGDFPTRSVFNWRLPTYAWLLGGLPDGAGPGLLAAAAVATLVLWGGLLVRALGPGRAAPGLVAMAGALGWGLGPGASLFTETWAGVLIAASLGLRRSGRGLAAAAAGTAALLLRELALPFVVLALVASCRGRRRGEAIAWGLGLAAFALLMAWHASAVLARVSPADPAMPGGWLRLGGVRFVLETSRMNLLLIGLPFWATALFVPTAVAGLLDDPAPDGRLLAATATAYLAAFAVVGAPFNGYWGLLTAPLLAIGLARAPLALAARARAAFAGVPGPIARPIGP